MKFKSIIFDLDGTLVDTLEDIYRAVNYALEESNFPIHEKNAYLPKIGRGWQNLCRQALPPESQNDETIQAIFETSYNYYKEHSSVYSHPYSGIDQLLIELQREKMKMAVLTNKPDSLAQEIMAKLFPAGTFSLVFGEREGVPRKPDPAAVWEILLELDCAPRNAIFVGDSEVDIETAKAAACHAVGVSWGFRDRSVLEKAGAERIIDNPKELLEIIKQK